MLLAGEDVCYGRVLGFKGLERPAVVLGINTSWSASQRAYATLNPYRNTGQAKEKLTMMGGSGFAMGAFGWLAMGIVLLALVGLVVWIVKQPRDRS